MATLLHVFWGEEVPRKVLLSMAEAYWGMTKEPVPSNEDDIVEQIVVDCLGVGTDQVSACIPKDSLSTIAASLPDPTPQNQAAKALRTSISAAIEALFSHLCFNYNNLLQFHRLFVDMTSFDRNTASRGFSATNRFPSPSFKRSTRLWR